MRPFLVPALVVLASSAPSFAQSSVVPSGPPIDVPRPPSLDATPAAPPATERVSFEVAVARALARNPSALVAQREIARAHALMEQVRASSLPTLNGVGSYTRIEGDRTLPGANTVVVPANSLNGSVQLSAPLIYPRGWVQWSHASDQVDVARANEKDVARSVAVATARAYLTIVAQKRLVEAARTARDNDRGHYDYTRQRLAGGVGNRIDEVRAAQQLSTDEATLQAQVAQLATAREALGVLLAADGPVDSADEATPTAMPALPEALNESQSRRADVRAREEAARAAERTVRDAWADYVPYLNLLAYPFVQSPATSSLPTNGWQAQLVLTVPLYDGGLRYGQEHERQALRDEANLQVEATLRQAKSDVRTAFEAMRRADEALQQARQAEIFAKQALDLANLAYRAGATTNLEVIDAERQARDAETRSAEAEDAARQARLDFLAASGRFP